MLVGRFLLFLSLAALSVSAIAAPQVESPAAYAARLADPAVPIEQREAAALWLAALKDKDSLGPLTQAVRDPDARVRNAAILALERLADPAAVPAMIDRLLDADCFHYLCRTLHRLEPRWRETPQARLLFQSLVEGFPDSCDWSLPGMKRPQWFELTPMIELDPDGAAAFFTECLARQTSADLDNQRRDMVHHLAHRKWLAAEPVLLSLLKRQKERIWAVAEALDELNPEWRRSDQAIAIARGLLARYTDTPGDATRTHLCAVLAQVPLPEALPFLTQVLLSPGKSAGRGSAIYAIAKFDTPQALGVLRDFLVDPDRDPDLVQECVRAIAHWDSSYARPILLDVLADRSRDEGSRRLAAILLLKFGQPTDVETVLEQATAQGQTPSLTEQLLDAVLDGTINGVMDRSARKGETPAELRSVRGRSCVRKLEALVNDRGQPSNVRSTLLMVLRGVEDPNSSTTLARLATDKAEGRDIREQALSALFKASPSKATEICWTLLRQLPPGFSVEAMVARLSNQGDKAIDRLVKRAGDLRKVQEALIRRGYASRLPKKKAIERIYLLLGQREQEYYYETLISQLLDLEGDQALVRLTGHESPRVRAWAAYIAFQKSVAGDEPR